MATYRFTTLSVLTQQETGAYFVDDVLDAEPDVYIAVRIDPDGLAPGDPMDMWLEATIECGCGETETIIIEIPDVYYVGQSPEGIIYLENGLPSLLSFSRTVEPGDEFYTEETTFICFCAGVMIATPTGEVAVETLRPGDLVTTADGGAAPVKWLFVQTVCAPFVDPARAAPVRIAPGALGGGLPTRTLRISQDHALYLDGALVQAGALVNGGAIARETELPERFAYYHLELADHALILANGAPAETYIDNVSRRAFDNWREYEAIWGPGDPIKELDFPRVKSRRQARTSLWVVKKNRRAA
jgi:hypothetical protein